MNFEGMGEYFDGCKEMAETDPEKMLSFAEIILRSIYENIQTELVDILGEESAMKITEFLSKECAVEMGVVNGMDAAANMTE